MIPFISISGPAAPFPLMNVDTDLIIPKQFLKTIKRTGLGRNLFNDARFTESGAERPDFVLNREPYRRAVTLIAGANFGCGSSREHAPWALLDFGIRCVIAPSFADIFFGNCVKNGILCIVMPAEKTERLMAIVSNPATSDVTVDLVSQTITTADGASQAFDIEPSRKQILLEGLDDIAMTLREAAEISAFEAARAAKHPWAFGV